MANTTRRDWMRTMAAAAALPMGARAARRPNVVLLLTDDQGYGDLACHGNPLLRTPNIDGLGKQGVEFNRFYVSPVCAPTRSSLLTGRYNLRCGVYGVTRGYETMRAEETTVAEALKGAGYRTALIGKWHLGHQYPHVPHAQGFDEFIGFRTGHWLNYFDSEVERNGKPYRTKGYISDAFTDEAIGFMERNRANPFFLYLAYNAPHSPFQVPNRYLERFKDKVPLTTAAVYGMVENLDANVGRVLGRIDELGLARDTIFVFLTDNGPAGQRFNSGLRGTKGSVYEGGVRVPFFVRCPGRFPAGRKVDRIAMHIDMYPTLLDLCGVTRPKGLPIDGTSIRPLMEGRTEKWPDRRLFTHRELQKEPSSIYPGAVRTERFNLVNGKELYEIPADPGEQNDVAAKYPDKVQELREAYESWYPVAAKECGFRRTPIPVGYAAENPVELPAPESYFDGELRYRNESGYAHDWICGWTRVEDSVWWEIDVAETGTYEIAVRYACPAADVGSQIAVTAGAARLEAKIEKGTSMDILPNRNLVDNTHYIDLAWATLPVGEAPLAKGRTRLTVKAASKPGAVVMELKSVSLRRK